MFEFDIFHVNVKGELSKEDSKKRGDLEKKYAAILKAYSLVFPTLALPLNSILTTILGTLKT